MGGEACGDAVSDALPEGDKTNHDARVVARDSWRARAESGRTGLVRLEPPKDGLLRVHRRGDSCGGRARESPLANVPAPPSSRASLGETPIVRLCFFSEVCTDCIEPA